MKIKFNRKFLSTYLKENNLTQAEFTRRLSRYVPTANGAVVKHWLDGRSVPSNKYLTAMCKVMTANLSQLILIGDK